MSKGKKKRGSGASAGGRRRPAQNKPSLVLPIVVGIVVLALVAGAIVSLERARSDPAGAVTPAASAQSLPTVSIPYPTVPRISLDEATARLDQGQAVLIDVRSKVSYDEAHAVGALSFPEEEIDARFDELPRDKGLILY